MLVSCVTLGPVRFTPVESPGSRPGGVAVKLFKSRPRPMSAPSQHTADVDLTEDGCPAWGAKFKLRRGRRFMRQKRQGRLEVVM